MADGTKIEWTHRPGTKGETWNPVRGCTRVSEGCRNCYAEVMAARFSKPGQWGHGLAKTVTLPDGTKDHRWTGKVESAPDHILTLPLRWKAPRTIFVNSTSDLFHEELPDEVIDRVFAVMALAPQHTYQVLTKRPGQMHAYLTDETLIERNGTLLAGANERVGYEMSAIKVDAAEREWPLPNVWIGVSVEDQATADERIPVLLDTPAALRWASYEPALGCVDFTPWLHESHCPRGGGGEVCICEPIRKEREPTLDWIICGGESGPGARPMHPDWARCVRDQCEAANVPFFMKQLSGPNGKAIKDMDAFPEDLRIRQWPVAEKGGAA